MNETLARVAEAGLAIALLMIPLWVLFFGARLLTAGSRRRRLEERNREIEQLTRQGVSQPPASGSAEDVGVTAPETLVAESQGGASAATAPDPAELAAKVDRLERSVYMLEKRLRGAMVTRAMLPYAIFSSLILCALGLAILARLILWFTS